MHVMHQRLTFLKLIHNEDIIKLFPCVSVLNVIAKYQLVNFVSQACTKSDHSGTIYSDNEVPILSDFFGLDTIIGRISGLLLP